MADTRAGMAGTDAGTDVLDNIQQRVLWLATRIVDAANHDRDTGDGVKVGGHQASSASLVTVMTALYFAHLDAPDKVSVKPHASPVFHAIQYLLGNLDRSYLPTAARLRRAAVLPEPHQGPRQRRLLHRLGGARRRGAAVRRGHPPLRRRALRRPAAAAGSSR